MNLYICILVKEIYKKLYLKITDIFIVSYKKKKSSVLWAIPIDSGSWWPMKQSPMGQFLVSRQEGIFLAIWSFSF